MGTNRAAEIDAWLRQGGIVVAASERAARAATLTYDQMRRSEHLSAWPAPRITHWQSFVRTEWDARAFDGRLVLAPEQELAVWRAAMQDSRFSATLLPASSRRIAAVAASAQTLLANYAPRYLSASARTEWQLDAAEFSRWLMQFDEICREQDLLSHGRLAGELLPLLRADQNSRPPLLLLGFDRLIPMQAALFDAWGDTKRIAHSTATSLRTFYATADPGAELIACARWAHRQLAEDASRRLMVIANDVKQSRGQLERAFLDAGLGDDIEFSLGVPLAGVGVVRAALHALHFLVDTLDEAELDWLVSCGYVAKMPATTASLQRVMRNVRRAGLERAEWTLEAFCRRAMNVGVQSADTHAWCNRMLEAQKLIAEHRSKENPIHWAMLTMRVLQTAGWPGDNPVSSAEYQAMDGFEHQVEVCGSLGFDGSSITFRDFLRELSQITAEALFSARSEGKRVLVAGPSESAGLEADAIWLLGATEENWPLRGDMHPLLPAWVQREAEMPHASVNLDWQLSNAVVSRLVASASSICFSYARQADGVDKRPSRIIQEFAGTPMNTPGELHELPRATPSVEAVEDVEQVHLSVPTSSLQVDSATITAQSQCPFRAFAVARLGARDWEPAHVGLSPSTRGKLLHDLLASVWSGPPLGISDAAQLRAIPDLRSFIEPHARAALRRIPAELRSMMPAPYLELEERRLTGLVCDWLEYERERADFVVEAVEHKTEPSIAGLTLKLRLDRIDRLNDGSVLIIDYKTGIVTPRSWDLPRPDDLQLPLYGEFGLDGSRKVGGIAFARLRAGDTCLAGRIAEPETTIGNVRNSISLRKKKLTAELLSQWHETIETMAKDFIAGSAVVDPREPGKTCERCGLQTVCRISQMIADEEQPDEVEA